MDIANLRGCFIDRALDHCCISLSSIAILAQEIQCVLACIRSHVWPRGYGVLAAFALLEARRPRSLPLHHVFGAALCESAFLHAGEHFGPHDGICVAGHSVPLPTALGFPGTASVAACSLGDGPPGRVVTPLLFFFPVQNVLLQSSLSVYPCPPNNDFGSFSECLSNVFS